MVIYIKMFKNKINSEIDYPFLIFSKHEDIEYFNSFYFWNDILYNNNLFNPSNL